MPNFITRNGRRFLVTKQGQLIPVSLADNPSSTNVTEEQVTMKPPPLTPEQIQVQQEKVHQKEVQSEKKEIEEFFTQVYEKLSSKK